MSSMSCGKSGILIFVACVIFTHSFQLRSPSLLSKKAIPSAVSRSAAQQLQTANAKEATRSVLVEIELPFKDNEVLQRIRNDIIVTAAIDANYTNFYFKILKTPDVPISCIFAYISELYSKSWNEAVVKSHFGANIVVFYEAWSNIDEQSLSLDAVYSNQPQRIQASPKEIINTNDLLSKFENSLKENKIIVVDDYPEGAAQLPTYNYVAVGGSFDQLHNGHKKLLYVSSLICLKELTVGITADNMLTKKTHSEEIQKFPERFANVQNFLQLMHSTLSLNLVEITDPFGPAITDAKIQALIVSSETIAGGFKINEIRTSKNMKRLDLIVISRSDSAILSSTFLRKQRLLRQQEQS